MSSKSVRVLTALLATTALSVGAAELEANLAASAGLGRAQAAHPGLSVGAVFAEPLTGRLLLQDVRFATGATHLTIGALNIPLDRTRFALIGAAQASPFDDKSEDQKPDEKPDGGAAEPAEPSAPADRAGGGPASEAPPAPAPVPTTVAGTTTADNVTIVRGATTYRVKHVELAGSPLANADLAALLDTNSTETIEARLRKLTATAITVPEVEIENVSGAARQTFVLDQIVLAGATAGKVASGTVGGTSFHETPTDAAASPDKAVEWTTGPVVATGIDFAQIAHLFEARRTNDAEPVLPLYDSVTVTNFKTLAKQNKSFTIAAIKETGAKARALKASTFPTPDEGPQTDAQKAARYADLVQSISIGSIELKDMIGGDSENRFALDSAAMKDFADGKLGGVEFAGLTFDSAKNKFAIGSFSLGAITLPPPSAIEKGTPSASSQMIPANVKVAIDRVSCDVDSADSAKKEPPNRVAFTLGHFGLVSQGRSGELPSSSTMALTNLAFDVPPTNSAKPLLEMGYRHVDLNFGISGAYDPDGQTLSFKDLSLEGVDMGSLSLAIGLINVTKGVTSSDPEVAKGSALAILVKSVALDVINKGLAEKALARQAQIDGVTIDKERETLVDLFKVKLPASVNNNANAKLIGDAVATFIQSPKNLHVSIVSKSGLGAASMGMLADPSVLLDALDVKASANQ